jgi:hypothetical protein
MNKPEPDGTYKLEPESRPKPPPAEPSPEPLPSLTDGIEGIDDLADKPTKKPAEPAPRAKSKVRIVEEPAEAEEDPEKPFVPEGLGGPTVVGAVGGVLLLAAIIVSAMTTKGGVFASSVQTAYQGLIHTVTGVAAVAIVARLANRKFGALESAAARMLVCVAVFLIAERIDALFGEGVHRFIGRTLAILLACGAYFGAVSAMFLRNVRESAVIAGLHAAMWLVVWVGSSIDQWAAPAAAATQGGTTP